MTDPAKSTEGATTTGTPTDTTSSSAIKPAVAMGSTTNPALVNLNKENNGSAAKEASTTVSSPKKRSASEDSCNDTKEVADAAKRTKSDVAPSATEAPNEAPLDLAVTLGYNPGDRVEVQWEVELNDETVVKWWGASLKPYDGRTTDSVAIRTLHYDACPDLGFDEPNDEDVIFLGDDLLVSPDSTTQLNYRREGEEDVLWLNEQDMDEQLNSILMGALSKNQSTWKNLEPAQQAIIAEKIKSKKEQLMEVLRSKKGVITSSSIQDILRETFGTTPASV